MAIPVENDPTSDQVARVEPALSAPGRRATAWASDDLIEAVESTNGAGPWTLAVQWHPEDDVEVGLFERFAEAVQ